MADILTELGDDGLLTYNSKYRVLVCCECKYAIQKSAIDSHLLRHKLYRGTRSALLKKINQLELLEPENVQIPPPRSRPVEGLPIIAGLKCAIEGCEGLCASSKRMRRHWSEQHGLSDPPKSHARPATLQTFFRGTKLRYFEVLLPEIDQAGSDQNATICGQDMSEHDLTRPALHSTTLSANAGPIIDLELLRYFHHFTTTTCHTLPIADHSGTDYWSIDVVRQALHDPWLMRGLLAISATHLAVISSDYASKDLHRHQAARLNKQFSSGWATVERGPSAVIPSELGMAAQIRCMQQCVHWSFSLSVLGIEVPTLPPTLESLLATIRSCSDPCNAFHVMEGVPFALSHICQSSAERHAIMSDARVKAPSEILELFRSLPGRMLDPLGRPDDVHEVYDTLIAIDVLVESCNLSFASLDFQAAWSGMEIWLRRMGEHFKHMIRQERPAALIVLAHWLILLKRVEQYCWFLEGISKIMLHMIEAKLPEDTAVRSLVKNVLDYRTDM